MSDWKEYIQAQNPQPIRVVNCTDYPQANATIYTQDKLCAETSEELTNGRGDDE